jgi:hypothetical protein
MRGLEGTRFLRWRRFAVDVLAAGAALAVAAAATSAGTQVIDVLLLSAALVGLGILIEPVAPARSCSATGLARLWRPLRSA